MSYAVCSALVPLNVLSLVYNSAARFVSYIAFSLDGGGVSDNRTLNPPLIILSNRRL